MRISSHFVLWLGLVLVLSGCGNKEGESGSESVVPVTSTVAGKYVSADGKTTLVFSRGVVKVSTKVVKEKSFMYAQQNNAVKWVYEQTGVAESCEIKSASELYCAVSSQTYKKIE